MNDRKVEAGALIIAGVGTVVLAVAMSVALSLSL
jgi:hypothetical protein